MDKKEVKEFLKDWLCAYCDYISDAEGEKKFNELFEHEWSLKEIHPSPILRLLNERIGINQIGMATKYTRAIETEIEYIFDEVRKRGIE